MSSSGLNHERKSWLMKRVSKFFKGGSDRVASGRRHPQYMGEEKMVWPAPTRTLDDRSRTEKEREEFDRAIKLSLADDMKKPSGHRWQTSNDEDLRTHRDKRNPPLHHPYNYSDYYPRGFRVCNGCKRDIGHGNYLGCMGTLYHPDCFRCRSCGYPITEHEL